MREIKFRLWNKRRKEYVDTKNYIYVVGALVNNKLEVGCDFPDGEEAMTDNFILEQYTGLKDKNGVEIYEGDVVKCTLTTVVPKFVECEVVYSKYYAGFAVKVPDESDFIYIGLHSYKNEYLEVIGNVHEEAKQ